MRIIEKNKITVIGSINMDLITSTNNLPDVGETVLGTSFYMKPGGKGANQAAAASKLGADVTMVGAVGADSFGETLIKNLTNQGVNTDKIEFIPQTATGIASITLSDSDNSIIVVPGANHYITPEVIDENETIIANSSLLLMQLEIPLESVIRAAEIAKRHGVTVILNPAPIQELPIELLELVDYLTPNEHEQELLFSSLKGRKQELEKMKEKCIVTKGSDGAVIYKNGEVKIPSFIVEAVDTTGAGDSFNGALAIALCEGYSLADACRFANAVAAISVTKFGAQSGMPTKNEVEEFLRTQNSGLI